MEVLGSQENNYSTIVYKSVVFLLSHANYVKSDKWSRSQKIQKAPRTLRISHVVWNSGVALGFLGALQALQWIHARTLLITRPSCL